MASNPMTEGPVKSLRQVPPGGNAFPIAFGVIAALIALGLVTNGSSSLLSILTSGVLLIAFLVPAFVLWSSARDSGLFITDDTVEFRTLGQTRHSWKRDQVREIKSSLRGVSIVGTDGRTLREFRYRYWRADQVEALARSAGLAPVIMATPGSEADPGKPGKG
ncbi:MAG: hypothetical protein QOK05_1356 [Chloroflexota bacterium]|jgi:hypothetical protein|nr:hypothetical protein [Chloroflexota bacterium]